MRARRRDHAPGPSADPARGPNRAAQGGDHAGGKGGAKGGSRAGRHHAGGRNPRRKQRKGKPKVDALAFWGDASTLPRSEADVRITEDAGAVPRSLGTPPLPGQETIAPHYFTAVYERAVMTAGALAAAGGLIDTETLTEELGE
jgi:hypothetical protein